MEIKQTPNLPFVNNSFVSKYLLLLKVDTPYKAFSISDDFKVTEGIGTIENDGMWNHHNNYDDSDDRLYFRENSNGKMSKQPKIQKWWTLNESEAIKLCESEKAKFVKLLKETIKRLES